MSRKYFKGSAKREDGMGGEEGVGGGAKNMYLRFEN